jgi:molybdopterin synthase catalytic subunit
MNIRVEFVAGPLPAITQPPDAPGGSGAVVVFEGVVRPHEASAQGGGSREIIALDYEAYLPMAKNISLEIARAVADSHALLALEMEHSTGRVRVGERSFRLRIAAAHRREALAAAGEFIDRMKQDAPIWKTPVARD